MLVKTTGRTDIENLFSSSGIIDSSKLNHTPFLAFVPFNYDVLKEIKECKYFLYDDSVKQRREDAVKEGIMTQEEINNDKKRREVRMKECGEKLKIIPVGVEVRIIYNSQELLTYTDDIPVMVQWRGQWRSDFFQFKVGELREHLKNKI